MKKHPADRWRNLGRQVYLARIKAGFADTQEWATHVGRSSRMLLGLERGEPVGNGTLDLVAVALEWPADMPYQLLENGGQPWGRGGGPAESVGAGDNDEPEFEFLTRVREDLTTEEMDQLMTEATPYLEMLVRDIKARNREQD